MKEGRYTFIQKEAEQDIQDSLDKSKGQIKDKKCLFHTSDRWKNQLIHGKHSFLGHKIVIEGINHKKIGRVGDECHAYGSENGGNHGSLFVLLFLIHDSRNADKACAKNKVGKFSYGKGAGTERVENVLDKLHQYSGNRSKTEGGKERREVGKVKFDKGGHKWCGNLKPHQDIGYCGENPNNGDISDSALTDLFFHSASCDDFCFCTSVFHFNLAFLSY